MPGDSDTQARHPDEAKRPEIIALIDTWSAKLREARDELGTVILGQNKVVDQIMTAMVGGGHVLAEGVPGTGKTLLSSSLSKVMGLDGKRIQFTPDMTPASIIGYEKEDRHAEGGLSFVKGPIFAQCVLCDEVNRAPPRTHSALLEVMQERQITLPGTHETHVLPRPFFVIATQNLLGSEGTYPLPEPQLDRFLFRVEFEYPKTAETEMEIVARNSGTKVDVLEQFRKVARGEDMTRALDPNRENPARRIITANELIALQDLARCIPAPDSVMKAAVDVVRRARPGGKESLDDVNKYLEWGPSVRASEAFLQAAKARALIEGHYSVTVEDIRAVAEPVLSHRMKLKPGARRDNVTQRDLIQKLVADI